MRIKYDEGIVTICYCGDKLCLYGLLVVTASLQCGNRTTLCNRELAEYIGCKHVVTTTPEEHDAVIAYTSQLMHVVAVALCDNPMIERSTFFSAGSLRDCTRVAIINAQMWSELFVENKEQLVNRIHEMQASLGKIAEAVENSDREKLEEIMTHATSQKMKWLME